MVAPTVITLSSLEEELLALVLEDDDPLEQPAKANTESASVAARALTKTFLLNFMSESFRAALSAACCV